MVIKITSLKALLTAMLFIMLSSPVFAQTAVGSLDGCFIARWGVDAGLYSGVIEFGNGVEPTSPPRSRDWFQGAAGDGLIDESSPLTIQTLLQSAPNPIYERRMKYPPVSPQNGQLLIDGLFERSKSYKI
jgi:hypothetical protein